MGVVTCEDLVPVVGLVTVVVVRLVAMVCFLLLGSVSNQPVHSNVESVVEENKQNLNLCILLKSREGTVCCVCAHVTHWLEQLY